MPNASLTFWIGFHLLLLVLFALEWFFMRRDTAAGCHLATAAWLLGALGFAAAIYFGLNHQLSTEFLAGYALEESLSVDNLFVFVLLFRAFQIEGRQQRRVLFWGILGAVVMRVAFIIAGVRLLERFSWITYIFGALLIIAAVRLVLPQHESKRNARPAWTKYLERWMPFSDKQTGFFATEQIDGHRRRMPTVLLLALIAIAVSDFVFAIDSIPAVLSITRHTFVAYTSNVMAVMGLRSLFFVLSSMLARLRYLHFGLAAVLAFAGIKMLLADIVEISAAVSLAVIFGVLALTAGISLASRKPQAQA